MGFCLRALMRDFDSKAMRAGSWCDSSFEADPSDRIGMQPWTQWQREIVTLLRSDFDHSLQDISLEGIDWISWRAFYEQGKSPRAAIERALERDL
jgi:hypothetical protein